MEQLDPIHRLTRDIAKAAKSMPHNYWQHPEKRPYADELPVELIERIRAALEKS
jgi:hypothetical protein